MLQEMSRGVLRMSVDWWERIIMEPSAKAMLRELSRVMRMSADWWDIIMELSAQSHSTGSVTSTSYSVGGLVGGNSGTISQSYVR